jgi:uncharacterized protein YcfJ
VEEAEGGGEAGEGGVVVVEAEMEVGTASSCLRQAKTWTWRTPQRNCRQVSGAFNREEDGEEVGEVAGGEVAGGEVAGGEVAGGEVAGGEVVVDKAVEAWAGEEVGAEARDVVGFLQEVFCPYTPKLTGRRVWW